MRDFNHTINILVKAYLNETLEHGVCSACAVGNIIADSIGAKSVRGGTNWKRGGTEIIPVWGQVFQSSAPGCQRVSADAYTGWTKKQIDTTGYTWQELARIEYAFELHNCGIDMEEDPEYQDEYEMDIINQAMFNGLMAVVDVLADIHGIDLQAKETAKALFVLEK
jgi:hypothetical protein